MHKDLLSLTEVEVKEELHVRHALEVERKERAAKRQRIDEIAEEEGLIEPKEVKKTLKEELLQDNKMYLDKID